MKQITTILDPDTVPERLRCFPSSDILYFDIETTGLSPRTAFLYLIGGAYFDAGKNTYLLTQWFAESIHDEKELLRSFSGFSSSFSTLVHFNGSTFDVPFVKTRLERYMLTGQIKNWEMFSFIDLFRQYSPYKTFFSLLDNKQTTWETFLATGREDKFSGGELITLYHHYTELVPCGEKQALEQFLLLHNFEDVKGLLSLTAISDYFAVFEGRFSLKDQDMREYLDFQHRIQKELFLQIKLPAAVPTELSYSCDYFYIKIKGDSANIRIPLYDTTLRYFYADYKNYYYLPNDDMAIHKSVGAFVDPAFRKKATAATCYSKKSGLFVKLPDAALSSPVFRESFENKESYTLYREDLFNETFLSHYLSFAYTVSRRTRTP